jgi:RNA polymerase sigma-70 factor, ECF subfamily
MHLSDNELAEAYHKSGDKVIIAEIYRRFGHLMFGTCLNYLKNKEEAEDCVMSIFEALPEKLGKHSVEHLKSWLFMMTKNACLMELRKKNRVTQELEADLQDEEGNSHSKVAVEEKITALEHAITLLKDEQRRTIELFYLERKSYTEISALLELPLKKVKSAIQNGKRNLKLILEENDSFKSA